MWKKIGKLFFRNEKKVATALSLHLTPETGPQGSHDAIYNSYPMCCTKNKAILGVFDGVNRRNIFEILMNRIERDLPYYYLTSKVVVASKNEELQMPDNNNIAKMEM